MTTFRFFFCYEIVSLSRNIERERERESARARERARERERERARGGTSVEGGWSKRVVIFFTTTVCAQVRNLTSFCVWRGCECGYAMFITFCALCSLCVLLCVSCVRRKGVVAVPLSRQMWIVIQYVERVDRWHSVKARLLREAAAMGDE